MNHTHGSLVSYTLGFVLSIACTCAAFYAVTLRSIAAIVGIIICAVIQLLVQLVFFLHLGKRGESQFQNSIFWFTCLIVTILVGGTVWIMTNLDHLHMHMPTMDDMYQGGVMAPQNELK